MTQETSSVLSLARLADRISSLERRLDEYRALLRQVTCEHCMCRWVPGLSDNWRTCCKCDKYDKYAEVKP